MAKGHRRTSLKDIENTGFTALSTFEGSRLISKDGKTNVRKSGNNFWERISLYHALLRMSRVNFLLLVFGLYTSINLFFACIYYAVGVEHLLGTETETTHFKQFLTAFFFSSQTLTTVGYGHVAPNGIMTNVLASAESLLGIVIFALITGIFYGRFSRPKAYLTFSHNILVSPYKGGTALMIRLATYKNNYLTDAEAVVTCAMHEMDGEKRTTKFYALPLMISKINSLALSWTLVHPLNEDSPLYNYSLEDLTENRVEIMIFVKAFDDHFSNIVQQRTSYTYNELVVGAKFDPMYERSEKGTFTLLELDKINLFHKVELPKEVVEETV